MSTFFFVCPRSSNPPARRAREPGLPASLKPTQSADELHRHAMDCPAPTRESMDPWPPAPQPAAMPARRSDLPAVVLPLLTRSSGLLNLLFQDGTVDLELASSVVALDPGLAFGTLQLANRDRVGKSNPIWLFPLAVVAAGRDLMLQLVNQAPRIESGARPPQSTVPATAMPCLRPR